MYIYKENYSISRNVSGVVVRDAVYCVFGGENPGSNPAHEYFPKNIVRSEVRSGFSAVRSSAVRSRIRSGPARSWLGKSGPDLARTGPSSTAVRSAVLVRSGPVGSTVRTGPVRSWTGRSLLKH